MSTQNRGGAYGFEGNDPEDGADPFGLASIGGVPLGGWWHGRPGWLNPRLDQLREDLRRVKGASRLFPRHWTRSMARLLRVLDFFAASGVPLNKTSVHFEPLDCWLYCPADAMAATRGYDIYNGRGRDDLPLDTFIHEMFHVWQTDAWTWAEVDRRREEQGTGDSHEDVYALDLETLREVGRGTMELKSTDADGQPIRVQDDPFNGESAHPSLTNEQQAELIRAFVEIVILQENFISFVKTLDDGKIRGHSILGKPNELMPDTAEDKEYRDEILRIGWFWVDNHYPGGRQKFLTDFPEASPYAPAGPDPAPHDEQAK